VKKWRRRLAGAPPGDGVLASRSRARRRPPPAVGPAVIERILAIRDDPPANLQRVPGPKAILSFLRQDDAAAAGEPLPRSPTTVWRLLQRHGRIARRRPHQHEPLDRPPPLTSGQIDFKDVSSVPPDADGKRQHVVETLTCVDAGTSILLEAIVRDDFTEETTLATLAEVLRAHGLPRSITLDRDPRFVGSAGNRDFPSPLLRLLACLGVEAVVTPPHRPDLKPFVERLIGSYDRECLRMHRPRTLAQAREATAAFARHYNEERPNQALSCGNRPPRSAFPALPALPALPARVEPDRWLERVDGRQYVRKVRGDGTVTVEADRYYLGAALVGQQVTLGVAAATGELVVRQGAREVKRLPIKGLRRAAQPLEAYLEVMRQEARARDRRRRARGTAA